MVEVKLRSRVILQVRMRAIHQRNPLIIIATAMYIPPWLWFSIHPRQNSTGAGTAASRPSLVRPATPTCAEAHRQSRRRSYARQKGRGQTETATAD